LKKYKNIGVKERKRHGGNKQKDADSKNSRDKKQADSTDTRCRKQQGTVYTRKYGTEIRRTKGNEGAAP